MSNNYYILQSYKHHYRYRRLPQSEGRKENLEKFSQAGKGKSNITTISYSVQKQFMNTECSKLHWHMPQACQDLCSLYVHTGMKTKRKCEQAIQNWHSYHHK